MTFPDCFVGAYVGWHAADLALLVLASATISTIISLPFWVRMKRDFGLMTMFAFAAFVSLPGLATCIPPVPDWVLITIAAAALAGAIFALFRGSEQRAARRV